MKRPALTRALGLALVMTASFTACSQNAEPPQSTATHLNPMIRALEQGQPVFGLYAPSARQRGAPEGTPAKSAKELAAETMAFVGSDFVFDGSMEGGVAQALPAFTAFADALHAAGGTAQTHPMIVKMSEIAPDPAAAARDIGQQLNAGVSGIMFVTVESAEEVRQGLAAMRFASNGGTRPDDVGSAPAYWGLSESEYREKADLWPLNPNGELVNWTIVESLEGLKNVRRIAAVEGIGVLWPGAGTLRRVFSSMDENDERVFDTVAWEDAIQSVLAACVEFDVPCGYPANASDIEERMAQGFSVFVMGWGESGFETIDVGRAAASAAN